MNLNRSLFFLTSTYLVLTVSCVKPPTTPPPPAPILWNSADLTSSTFDTGGAPFTESFMAGVTLSVNGLPEATDKVTLTCPGGSTAALTYVGPVTVSGKAMAYYSYTKVNTALYPIPFITYRPGQKYILTTVTSAGTAAVTAVAPGGFTGAASIAPPGLLVSWPYGGTNDHIWVVSSGAVTTFTTTGNAISPVLIPASAYTSFFSGAYFTFQRIVTTIPGARVGSSFSIAQRYWQW